MNRWYAAHLVLFVRFTQHLQDHYPLWENIVLLNAESEEEAFCKAEQRGRTDAQSDPSFRWGGKPAEWVFAGVRKLTLCEDSEQQPTDGTELTYSELEVTSEQAVYRFVKGDAVTVEVPSLDSEETESVALGTVE